MRIAFAPGWLVVYAHRRRCRRRCRVRADGAEALSRDGAAARRPGVARRPDLRRHRRPSRHGRQADRGGRASRRCSRAPSDRGRGRARSSRSSGRATSLQHALDAHVVDSSDVVAVTVEDTSADGAAQLANAFAERSDHAADRDVPERAVRGDPPRRAAARRDAEGASVDGRRCELARRLATLRELRRASRIRPSSVAGAGDRAHVVACGRTLPKLIGLGAGDRRGARRARRAADARRPPRLGAPRGRAVRSPVSARRRALEQARRPARGAARRARVGARGAGARPAGGARGAAGRAGRAARAAPDAADDSELTRREQKLERARRRASRSASSSSRAAPPSSHSRERGARGPSRSRSRSPSRSRPNREPEPRTGRRNRARRPPSRPRTATTTSSPSSGSSSSAAASSPSGPRSGRRTSSSCGSTRPPDGTRARRASTGSSRTRSPSSSLRPARQCVDNPCMGTCCGRLGGDGALGYDGRPSTCERSRSACGDQVKGESRDFVRTLY